MKKWVIDLVFPALKSEIQMHVNGLWENLINMNS